ncbi:MAG: hypothetical protein CVT60_06515 [Actinobacteria bacterium HGW-Actinobacteria-10]|nr:MAG: hypothetical protein CVT60_06515 [Actinobacteria bacterium HGW-Actinobacteria-10]
MGVTPVLQIIALVAGTAFFAVAIFGVFEAVATLRSVRRLSDEVHTRLVPLIEKANITVDAFNAELLRIDGIVTQIEEVSDRVSSTTNAVQDAVHGPIEAVSNMGARLRGVLKRHR